MVTELGAITEAEDLPPTKETQVTTQCIKDVNTAIGLLSWDYENPSNRTVRNT
ncbi:hypothetical protein [Pedobacter insulae]|uniref:hypothetical protein n=1 Tax=Pedobacter insulae TaxID=414048 RepID=UPI0015A63E9F|nr:hypothetical protein [Pedobacter insulae]